MAEDIMVTAKIAIIIFHFVLSNLDFSATATIITRMLSKSNHITASIFIVISPSKLVDIQSRFKSSRILYFLVNRETPSKFFMGELVVRCYEGDVELKEYECVEVKHHKRLHTYQMAGIGVGSISYTVNHYLLFERGE